MDSLGILREIFLRNLNGPERFLTARKFTLPGDLTLSKHSHQTWINYVVMPSHFAENIPIMPIKSTPIMMVISLGAVHSRWNPLSTGTTPSRSPKNIARGVLNNRVTFYSRKKIIKTKQLLYFLWMNDFCIFIFWISSWISQLLNWLGLLTAALEK